MHPAAQFRDGSTDWLAVADARGFAHIFAVTATGPMMVHAPVTRDGNVLPFHVSRANRIARKLSGTPVIASVATVDGYISPNWYADPIDQVPTWNFVAVEFEGVARPLDQAATVAHLDALAARHEPRVNPAAPWSRDKMDPARFAAMLTGIAAFSIDIIAIRETVKLSQHRPSDLTDTLAGLRAVGCDALADAMAAA